MSTQTIAHSPRSARRWPLAATTLGLALAALVALTIITQPARPAFRPAAGIHPVTAAQLVELKQNQAEAREAVVVLARALPDATTATELVELKQNQAEAQGIVRALPDATTATELVELKQNQVESR